jgi:spore germination cell wall hydrolase CwlJ-like protein
MTNQPPAWPASGGACALADADLLALCAFEEANLEPDDGLAAVVRVIKNRMARRFQSDGTLAGTVFHGDGAAFSWAAFAMEEGRYVRVASGPAQIAARAQLLLSQARGFPAAWARASRIAAAVAAGTYAGPAYAALTDDAVLYLNPALARAAWATPDKFVCAIGRHHFFRA